MADELNTPDHRWYQKRYNIPLAKEDFSKQWIYDSGIQKIDAWIALLGGTAPVSAYAVNNFDPSLVFDFGEDYFRTSGSVSTFSDSITHSATTNGTMVDSDGLLKWRPHNLVRYSEDFSAYSWTELSTASLTTGVEDYNGGNSAVTVTALADGQRLRSGAISILQGPSYTISGYIRRRTGTGVVTLQSLLGVQDITSIISDGEWHLIEIEETSFGVGAYWFLTISTSGDAVDVCFPHIYRSDLGGMVDNPDRGDSYVPTTTSAVYLPRRGHHVYNGSAWVNEGLLHESEARTNLITNNRDIAATGGWSGAATATANSATGIDGVANAATTLSASFANSRSWAETIADDSNYHTASIYIKKETSVSAYPGLALVYNGGTSVRKDITFNPITGQFLQRSGQTDGGVANVEDFEDFWRVSLTVQNNSTGNTSLDFAIYPAASATFSAVWGASGPQTIIVDMAQLEKAATSSSVIPTAGATVTRAAETLTVPAANLPWPSPVVIGEELVTNGAFDTDTTGWTSASAGTLSWVDGRMRLEVADGDTNGGASQSVTVEVGKVYQFSADVTNISDAGLLTLAGATTYGLNGFTTNQNFNQIFVATTTTLTISIFAQNAGVGPDTIDVDNISVREINPLSVSIQMQGRMTYADTGNSEEVVFSRWLKDSSNLIQSKISTGSTFDGYLEFLQRVSGISDTAQNTNAFDPGILVPFNIASRHGSTFINGAVDGSALTADTTPVALPDLSATDLSIGYDMMGTIKLFRMWSDDLADEGIEEASA
jgi:hypothetical protein